MRCMGERRKEFRCLEINGSSCHQLDMKIAAELFALIFQKQEKGELVAEAISPFRLALGCRANNG